MDSRRKGPPRPPSPVTFWPGLTQIIPSQPVQRPPPPVVHRPADGASVRTGSSHGSSTIKASRAHFGLFGFVTRSKDKSNTDGGSTITPKGPAHGRSPFDILPGRKSKTVHEPAQPSDPNARSEAAEYLESMRATVMPHSEPLHPTSSRALQDLMSPLVLRRSRDDSSAFFGGSAGSESPVKSEDDDRFLKELEAGVGGDVPVWLSAASLGGSSGSASVSRPHRDRSVRRRSKEIRRSSSNGSLGSDCGDDESYSNDGGSSEDDANRPDPNYSPNIAYPRGPPVHWRHRAPPSMTVTRENFRPPVPAPAGMPPDPFAFPDPFAPERTPFQMDSVSHVDPTYAGGIHPPNPNYLNHYATLDTIPSDSEQDGVQAVRRQSQPANPSKLSFPPQSPTSDRRAKIDKARASAGFSRRAGGGRRHM